MDDQDEQDNMDNPLAGNTYQPTKENDTNSPEDIDFILTDILSNIDSSSSESEDISQASSPTATDTNYITGSKELDDMVSSILGEGWEKESDDSSAASTSLKNEQSELDSLLLIDNDEDELLSLDSIVASIIDDDIDNDEPENKDTDRNNVVNSPSRKPAITKKNVPAKNINTQDNSDKDNNSKLSLILFFVFLFIIIFSSWKLLFSEEKPQAPESTTATAIPFSTYTVEEFSPEIQSIVTEVLPENQFIDSSDSSYFIPKKQYSYDDEVLITNNTETFPAYRTEQEYYALGNNAEIELVPLLDNTINEEILSETLDVELHSSSEKTFSSLDESSLSDGMDKPLNNILDKKILFSDEQILPSSDNEFDTQLDEKSLEPIKNNTPPPLNEENVTNDVELHSSSEKTSSSLDESSLSDRMDKPLNNIPDKKISPSEEQTLPSSNNVFPTSSDNEFDTQLDEKSLEPIKNNAITPLSEEDVVTTTTNNDKVNTKNPLVITTAKFKTIDNILTLIINEPTKATPVSKTLKYHHIVEGETLWSIAKRYINTPSKFPNFTNLSGNNKPVIIYSGDIINIVHYSY